MPEPSDLHPIQAQSEIIGRPPGQLFDLPLKYRWEVTRRHPYYLVFWRSALLHRQGETDDPHDAQMRFVASLMLNSIGVTGEPVDPGDSFEKLGDVDPAFLSGAIQPMTLRALAMLLIHALPAAERAAVGAFLLTSGSREYARDGDVLSRNEQAMRASIQLARVPSSILDSYPDTPLFFIHLGASQRTIVSDVENFVRRRKQQTGIPERRFHAKKLPLYLQVWDLREGWNGNQYERDRDQTLKQISRQLKTSLSTVYSRYTSAFQLITGHRFSVDIWRQTIGPLKVSGLYSDSEKILSAPIRRRLQPTSRREAADSVITPASLDSRSPGVVESMSASTDGALGVAELLMDLDQLIAQGVPIEEIAKRLERSPADILYYQGRTEEFQQLRDDGKD